MKKLLIFILVIILIAVASVYIFIPGELKISAASVVTCIPKNIATSLSQPAMNRWWPEQITSGGAFAYKGYEYVTTGVFSDGAEIEMAKGGRKNLTRIIALESGKDSTTVEWKTSFKSSFNPVQRIKDYYEAVEIKTVLEQLLNKLALFAGKTENIYGFPIERTTFTDTILYATRFSSKTYPTVQTIYEHVDELRSKIAASGSVEKDFPMLNVNRIDSLKYEIMIAICVNNLIPSDKENFATRMVPMKDRFLKTTAVGGNSTIQLAYKAVDKYMDDHLLSAPAIPFEILVTDRRKEADSTKWKTIIFQPSM